MKVRLSCPQAVYGDGMKIICTKTGRLCAHQFFKRCKGWWALNPNADRCPVRRQSDGTQHATDQNRGN